MTAVRRRVRTRRFGACGGFGMVEVERWGLGGWWRGLCGIAMWIFGGIHGVKDVIDSS